MPGLTTDVRIGAAVAACREESGLSPTDLAQRLAQTKEWIAGLERGQTKITPTLVLALAQALGISPQNLLERAEQSNLLVLA